MSKDRYQGRRDPYITPQRDYPPDSRRNGEAYSHPLGSNDAPRDTEHQREPRGNYGNTSDESTDRYNSGSNNHRSQQREERSDAKDHNYNHSYDRNNSYDGYHKRHPDENTGRDIQQRGVIYPVRFHGKTSEYFKIWIVNVFLTVVTLYIYSAWAKVRTKRYFYGNTTVDNSSFEYHATGRQLVVGRLIAAALLITYTFFKGISLTIAAVALGLLVIMFPWAIWRSLRFNARASSYRNVRFGFEGQSSPPYVNVLVIPLIILGLFGTVIFGLIHTSGTATLEALTNRSETELYAVAGGLLIGLVLLMTLVVPLLHKNLISYSLNNHRYGTTRFSANIKTGRIYGVHLVTIFLSLLAMIAIGAMLYGLFQLFLLFQGVLDNIETLTRLEPYADILIGMLLYLLAIPITGIAVAFFRSRIRNHRYNATTIGSRVKLESTTTMWSLWWLNISNLALLIISLGIAYPFTKIRSARYFARHTNVIVAGGLDSFTEQEKTRLHAMGEEMADAFDVEFDIGI